MDNVDKDNRILAEFIRVFCNRRHGTQPKFIWNEVDLGIKSPQLCDDCSKLLSYSVARRELCPLGPKPSCKNCEIHCYAPEYRQKIREVMKYSGKYLILHGRLDLLFHYLF